MQCLTAQSHVLRLRVKLIQMKAVVPAASSKASSRACVSGSTVLKSTPSVALDKSSSEAVFIMGLSRSSWSKMNDSTWERQEKVGD